MNRLCIDAIDFAQYYLELVNCKIIRAIGETITQEAADYTGTSLNTIPTTTTGVGDNTQIINAKGYRLVGDGSGNAFLTMKNGIPQDWGGGTLYDPQGRVVTHGTL